MFKWVIGLAAAAALAVAIPSFAGADGNHECTLDLTVRASRVRIFSGHPPASGHDLSAGTVDGTICGDPFHGAMRQQNRYPNPPGFKTNVATFGPVGSFRSKGNGTAALNGDGSVDLRGQMRIVGGTGIYDDPSGSIRFTGHVPFRSSVATFHFRGTIEY